MLQAENSKRFSRSKKTFFSALIGRNGLTWLDRRNISKKSWEDIQMTGGPRTKFEVFVGMYLTLKHEASTNCDGLFLKSSVGKWCFIIQITF